MLVTCRDPSEIQIRTLAKSVFYRLGWPTGIQSTLAGLPVTYNSPYTPCLLSPQHEVVSTLKAKISITKGFFDNFLTK